MKIAFVSTVNLKLYNEYGKRFIFEFAEYASSEVKLFIVFEGEIPEELLNLSDNIIVMPLVNEKFASFFQKFGKLQEARGMRFNYFYENDKRMVKLDYDYKFNAVKFSYKPFSILQSLDYTPDDLDYLIWTDADLRCKKKFEANDLVEFMPENEYIMSYLGRKNAYSECGFLGFNLKNERFIRYIERVIEIYTSGEFFTLDEWHDSYIWDHVRMEFEKNYQYKFKNLATGDAFEKEHVYINTNLDNFFDHLKGPQRKIDGHSTEDDYSKMVI